MISKISLSFIAFIAIFLSAYIMPVNADVDSFFSPCANPQGEKIASYSEGVHGVAGNTNSYSGSDSVYKQSNGNNVQCLCTISGEGIQTNWLKANNLTDEEISVYKNQGWTYIADGSAWGLDQAPYLTKNISYNCVARGGTSDSKVGGASAEKSDPINSILSLASTGNILFIIAIFMIGFIFVGTGLTLSRQKRG